MGLLRTRKFQAKLFVALAGNILYHCLKMFWGNGRSWCDCYNCLFDEFGGVLGGHPEQSLHTTKIHHGVNAQDGADPVGEVWTNFSRLLLKMSR